VRELNRLLFPGGGVLGRWAAGTADGYGVQARKIHNDSARTQSPKPLSIMPWRFASRPKQAYSGTRSGTDAQRQYAFANQAIIRDFARID